MDVSLHHSDDLTELQNRVARESNAWQRDRYRAVLLAATERLEGDQIAQRIGRSPRFVDEWLARYRRGGLAALRPRKQPGKRPRLSAAQEAGLKARLDGGPAAADGGVAALRGRDVVRILKEEFGVHHTMGSIYGVLHRIGYSCLAPRPRHEKNDPQQIQRFKRDAPFLSRP
jgi:transposase